MGVFYETLPPKLVGWLLDQKVFWIGSAPLSGEGHINVSPKGVSDKGGPFFGVVKEREDGKAVSADDDDDEKDIVIRKFWYMDLTGSGIETTSHLHEPGNARITVMFNAFTGPPRILRLFGKGRVLEYGTPAFNDIISSQNVTIIPGTRSIIMVDIHQVGTSCGFSMPLYDFVAFRPTLNDFFEKRVANEKAGKREDGIERYWAYKNAFSMDGLPGMQRGLQTGLDEKVRPIKKMIGRMALVEGQESRRPQKIFLVRHVVLVAVMSSVSTAVFIFLLLRFFGLLDPRQVVRERYHYF
ncbi:hypothetical protein PV11_00923 [Exophiala sideris]|uniref:Pyridoxamine 5'-phosphate oxidase putative domain-containing protein n=1 Tax=Exophiala sideris TaxID=1016849 RepID=A0A0D1XBB8_9EURO|nr:hypothetical protein PV11_00923 [Exophiala sideris]